MTALTPDQKQELYRLKHEEKMDPREAKLKVVNPGVYEAYKAGGLNLSKAEQAVGLRDKTVRMSNDLYIVAGILSRHYGQRTRQLIDELQAWIDSGKTYYHGSNRDGDGDEA